MSCELSERDGERTPEPPGVPPAWERENKTEALAARLWASNVWLYLL